MLMKRIIEKYYWLITFTSLSLYYFLSGFEELGDSITKVFGLVIMSSIFGFFGTIILFGIGLILYAIINNTILNIIGQIG